MLLKSDVLGMSMKRYFLYFRKSIAAFPPMNQYTLYIFLSFKLCKHIGLDDGGVNPHLAS